jgi:HK97 family phage prohead protease
MPIETYNRTWDLADIEIQRGGDGRTVTAYAAVFGQEAEISDRHGRYVERIDPKSFNRTLTMRPVDRIGVLYNHGYDASGQPNMVGSVPIGTPLSITPDGNGLLTVTRYNKSDLADAVLEAIRDGQIKGQSFRGRIIRSDETKQGGRRYITRTELGLSEYGPTHAPAYTGAGILALRSESGPLAELLRTMIRNELQGIDPTALTQDISPETVPADPAESHSRQTRARRNIQRARAIALGVHSGKAEDQR